MNNDTLYHQFNKIRVGGQSADLEGYAFSIENTGSEKKAILWYLSMVGHKGSVEAIWASILKSPPVAAVLYYEETEDEGNCSSGDETRQVQVEQKAPKEAMVWLADPSLSGGWTSYKIRLDKAQAFQLVLLPQAAMVDNKNSKKNKGKEKEKEKTVLANTAPTNNILPTSKGEKGQQKNNHQEQSQKAEVDAIDNTEDSDKQFLLFFPATSVANNNSSNGGDSNSEEKEKIPVAYYYRLNQMTNLPIHQSWAKFLWQRAEDSGEVKKLICGGGVQVYLCKTPKQSRLLAEISEAVRLREVPIP